MWRVALGTTAGLFLAFMAAVHDPTVQGIMGVPRPVDASAAAGGCPFGYDAPRTAGATPTPSLVAIVQHVAAGTRTAALATAPARPALGFDLGATTRADILAWAEAHAVPCTPLRDGSSLECSAVPVGALTADPARLASASAWFEFRGDTLVRVKTLRRADVSVQVEGAFDRTRSAIAAQAGTPTATSGRPELLARGPLQQSSAEFTYRNYVASVRATNLGHDGYVLTESYAAR